MKKYYDKLIGKVEWEIQPPFYHDTYTGITKNGLKCVIHFDNRTKVYVDGLQVGSDEIKYWHLRYSHLKSLIDGLDSKCSQLN